MQKKGKKRDGGAKQHLVDGVLFKSGLEVFCYRQLLLNHIPADYEKHKFTLVDKFTSNSVSYHGKTQNKEIQEYTPKIQAITFKPDFVNTELGFVIETKGIESNGFTLRWKMFKKYLLEHNLKYDLYLPRNQAQVSKVIEIIKQKLDDKNK